MFANSTKKNANGKRAATCKTWWLCLQGRDLNNIRVVNQILDSCQ